MTFLLAGDIGGTKTILRLVASTGSGTPSPVTSLVTVAETQYVSAEFPDLVPMVQQFLAHGAAAEAIAAVSGDRAIARACFGIAGPVVDNTSQLTNLSWNLDGDRLAHDLHIPQIELINDFAAIGYGILGLRPEDLHVLQEAEPQPTAPIAILGAGTGLGEGFLVPQGDRYHVYGSEGGHADFAPRSALECELMLYLREKFNIDRVSVERVVSGQGIVAIYQFLRDRGYGESSAEVTEAIHTWEREMGRPEKTIDPGAAISRAAIESSDPLCEKTLELFVAAYGAEAGNLALKFLPYGGLYVAGGIAAKILPLFDRYGFHTHFATKGRVSKLLEAVPVYVVLNPQVGLIGAAVRAAQLLDA
jgi:glucokinase